MKISLTLIPDDGICVYQEVIEIDDPADISTLDRLDRAVTKLELMYEADKEKCG